MVLTIYMTVAEHHTRGTGDWTQLWCRQMQTDAAPQVGQRVELCKEGPMVEVRDLYWQHDGEICVELQALVVDPDDREQSEMQRAALHSRSRSWSWWTQSERGRPEERLEAGGWTRH